MTIKYFLKNGQSFSDICLDAKILFDDNAEFRQKEVFKLRDKSQEDISEVEAAEHNLVSLSRILAWIKCNFYSCDKRFSRLLVNKILTGSLMSMFGVVIVIYQSA